MSNVLNELKTLVERELGKIVRKGDLTMTELGVAKEAVCLLKMIDDVEVDYEEMDYSESMKMPSRSSYGNMNGSSNMRGRNQRNGQYMSRNSGMSNHSIKDRAIAALESMVDTAESDYERQEIIKLIDKVQE